MKLHHAYEAHFCISVLEIWTADHGVYEMGWYQSSTLSMKIPNTSIVVKTSACQMLVCQVTCVKQIVF